MAQPKMPKVALDQAAIRAKLNQQLGFLEKSMAAYDQGETDEYLRLANAVQTIVYSKGQTRGLLDQLDLAGLPVRSITDRAAPDDSFSRLRVVVVETNMEGTFARYLPLLKRGASRVKSMSLDGWWNETIINVSKPQSVEISRKRLIAIARDQDGGAHVDAAIEADYDAVAKGLGGWWIPDMNNPAAMVDVERASIRHIAFELWDAVKREDIRQWGNERCDCGKGRPRRYCCGRAELKAKIAEIDGSIFGKGTFAPGMGVVSTPQLIISDDPNGPEKAIAARRQSVEARRLEKITRAKRDRKRALQAMARRNRR